MSDSTQNPPPPEEGGPTPPGGVPYPPPGGATPPGGGSYQQGGGSYQPPPPPPPYQQAPPPPYQQPSGVGMPADLMPRFVARLIDYILLAVVNGILVGLIVVGVFMGDSTNTFLATSSNYAAAAVSAIIGAAIYLGYFSLMESRTGQTVGKMVMKLETRGATGGHPTLEEALKRNAFTAINLLALIPFVGGVISGLASLAAVISIAVTVSNSPNRRGWHDQFAGTQVIKIG